MCYVFVVAFPIGIFYFLIMENKKVTGIGGVFIKAQNRKDLCAWYDKHLGTSFNGNTYTSFNWKETGEEGTTGSTVFNFFAEDSKYFDPSTKTVMLNLRVTNLIELLAKLKADGVQVVDKVEEYDYGKFGWIIDAEGNKIELWEPK